MKGKPTHLWPLAIFGLLAIILPKNCPGETLDRWLWQNPPPGGNLVRVSYGDGIFVALGKGGAIYTSREASTWVSGDSGTETPLFDVAYGGGAFVAVGRRGKVVTSPDGRTWTLRDSGTASNLHGVAYGGGTFVAVGDGGAILTSPDGVAWALRESGTGQVLKMVAFGDGSFVAVGWHGTVLRSAAGVEWKIEPAPTSGHLEGVAYGGGVFVAVGETILASPDGAAWTEGVPRTNHRFRAVAYGGGSFVAVGDDGAIFTSAGGTDWTSGDSGVRSSFSAVAYGNGTFVAAARDGTVLKAPSVPAPRISVSPGSMDFGSVNVGFSSIQTLTITNSGSAGLSVSRMATGGVNVIDFITQNDQCTGKTVAVSASCSVQVVFSPHSLGAKSATLSISSNDPSTPTAVVPLSGSSGGVTPISGDGDNSFCFISWLVDGWGPEKILDIFREFRDAFLLQTAAGQALVRIYYEKSPALVLFFAPHPSWSEAARWGLVPIAALAYSAVHTSCGEKAFLLAWIAGLWNAGWVYRRAARRARALRPPPPETKRSKNSRN